MNDTGIFADDKVLGESSYFQECFLKMFSTFFVSKIMIKSHICASMYPVKTRQKAKNFTGIAFLITIEIQFLSYLQRRQKKRD